MYPHVHIYTYTREYFCPLPLGPPSWSSCAILFTIQLSVNSPRAERAFCLARHSSSRSNARGPLWITPTDVPPPVSSSLFLFFLSFLLLSHSLCPFCWKKERLRYRWSTSFCVKLRITTIVWTVCTLIVSRQVVKTTLSRRKKRGIICGRRRNGGLMVNNEIEGNG